MAKPKKATRAQVGLRVPEDLRERVENAAKVSGRSLNAEILERLEQSFRTEERFGGPILSHIVECIANVMNVNGQRAADTETGEIMASDLWLNMPYPYDQSKGAVIAFLENFKPPGKIVVPNKRSLAEAVARRGFKFDSEDAVMAAERAGYIARKILLPGSLKKEQDNE